MPIAAHRALRIFGNIPSLSRQKCFGNFTGSTIIPNGTLDLDALKQRKKAGNQALLPEMYERIWKGSMLGLVSGKLADRNVFYNSYLQAYIERDVSELIARVDKLQFQDFICAASCRAGQMLNVHDIAMDIGVSDNTAKRWLRSN